MPESNTKTIEIACPHQRKIVKALYPCRSDGRYLSRADGSFDLELVQCSQDDGRCAETLCALHRFNHRGTGTWYPDQIRTVREGKKISDRPTGSGNQKNQKKDSFDQFC